MAEDFKVPNIDYSSRSFAEIRDDLIALIPFYTAEWTDFNKDDLGIVLLELMAGIADSLHYYLDRGVSESWLSTAFTETAIKNHLALIDYFPKEASPSVVTLQFTVQESATLTDPYLIPKLTQVSTQSSDALEGVVFETDEDLVIPVGQTIGTITAIQGETAGIEAPNGEVIGISDGTQFQSFGLNNLNPIKSSIEIFVKEVADTFFKWNEVDSFVDQESDSKVFKVIKKDNSIYTIVFGDNVNGAIPMGGAELQAAYRIGGGKIGNVGAGTITKVLSSLPNGFTVAVTNPESAQGGTDSPSLQAIKELGPLSLKTFGRAVTSDDYESIALEQDSVAAASAVFDSEESLVNLYIAASDGTASTLTKKNVKDAIEAVDLFGVGLAIKDPTLVPIDIEGTVTIKDTFSRVKIGQQIDSILDSYFTISKEEGTVYFDRDVFEAVIFCLIQDIDGVEAFEITKLMREPTIDLTNWNSKTSTITVVVDSTNTIEQEINITLPSQFNITDPFVEYTVIGSVTGEETDKGKAVFSGSTPIPFTLQNQPVTITIVFPSLADIEALLSLRPVEGDQLTITVGKWKGSQTIKALEIAQQGNIVINVTGGNI